MSTAAYDPFAAGRFPVGVRTIQALDPARGRLFPCEVWYPARTGSAGRPAGPAADRDTADRDTAGPDTAERDAAAHPGAHPLIVFSHYSGGSRRSSTFLCTHLASHGYVVAAPDHSEVVAAELMGPDAKTGAERSARIDAMVASRVLRRADHQHFVDDVEGEHEALRAMSLPGDAAWLPAAMRPITELCPAGQAHTFTRGLALAHLDATLRRDDAASRFLAGDVEAELAARGVDAFAHRP